MIDIWLEQKSLLLSFECAEPPLRPWSLFGLYFHKNWHQVTINHLNIIAANRVKQGLTANRLALPKPAARIQVPSLRPSSVNKKDDKGSNGVDTSFEPLALPKIFIS